MLRSNTARSASLIQYIYDDGTGSLKRDFSEVLYFFYPDWKDDKDYQLAFVRTFPVQAKGRLLFRSGKGKTEIILAEDTEELLGFVVSKGREYLISRNHPYLAARSK
jgi:hypothetical protein